MNVDITPTDGFPHMYDYVNGAVGAGCKSPCSRNPNFGNSLLLYFI